jgi:hypothetical protein
MPASEGVYAAEGGKLLGRGVSGLALELINNLAVTLLALVRDPGKFAG